MALDKIWAVYGQVHIPCRMGLPIRKAQSDVMDIGGSRGNDVWKKLWRLQLQKLKSSVGGYCMG
jgi:hypothetical protein